MWRPTALLSSNRRHTRGQALAEFALVAPIFLLILFGILDIGRVVWANDIVANAAREGARYASVSGNSELTTYRTKAEIKDYTRGYLIAAGNSPQVTVCYSPVYLASGTGGCTGDTNTGGVTTAARGVLVTVRVTTSVPIFAGGLLGIGQFTVSSTSTVLVNN